MMLWSASRPVAQFLADWLDAPLWQPTQKSRDMQRVCLIDFTVSSLHAPIETVQMSIGETRQYRKHALSIRLLPLNE